MEAIKQAKTRKPYTHKPEWKSKRGVLLRIDRELLNVIVERMAVDNISRNEVVRRLINKGITHYDDVI